LAIKYIEKNRFTIGTNYNSTLHNSAANEY